MEAAELRWPVGKLSALGQEVRNSILLKMRLVWGLLHIKSCVVDKSSKVGFSCKYGEGGLLRCRLRHLTSDHSSKSRGPSKNIPRLASKLDTNITKLH
ncbi:hypothetical protein AVEN_114472-1 [Araneus ventricosus]|uniref:Uncharacterized protein n=1 Tax=Araneus ventricosus TaxID=182803 RepID=A0A4Y2I4D1_ARAVE|nr:hypothetical protein AVEN_114472-1 [Araneus ventricosus]